MTSRGMRDKGMGFFSYLDLVGTFDEECNALAFFHLLPIYMIEDLVAYIGEHQDERGLTNLDALTMIANL